MVSSAAQTTIFCSQSIITPSWPAKRSMILHQEKIMAFGLDLKQELAGILMSPDTLAASSDVFILWSMPVVWRSAYLPPSIRAQPSRARVPFPFSPWYSVLPALLRIITRPRPGNCKYRSGKCDSKCTAEGTGGFSLSRQ